MIGPSNWRDFLAVVIAETSERERIARTIGVKSITLTRWASGESRPRQHNLNQLLYALSQQDRAQFRVLLEAENLDAASYEQDNPTAELPTSFIMDILDQRASLLDNLRLWSLSQPLLTQALGQLDPEQLGLAITIVQCMQPSREGKVCSLREIIGLGTGPWKSPLEEKSLFLGSESLAGYAVAACRPMPIHDFSSATSFLPAYNVEHEKSAIAYPFLYASRVAGCLLLSSTQPDYFAPPWRSSLIHNYTNLVSLLFEPKDFYPPEQINLGRIPPLGVQQRYMASFRERVIKIVKEASATRAPLNNLEAQLQAWQEIEQLVLNHVDTEESI